MHVAQKLWPGASYALGFIETRCGLVPWSGLSPDGPQSTVSAQHRAGDGGGVAQLGLYCKKLLSLVVAARAARQSQWALGDHDEDFLLLDTGARDFVVPRRDAILGVMQVDHPLGEGHAPFVIGNTVVNDASLPCLPPSVKKYKSPS